MWTSVSPWFQALGLEHTLLHKYDDALVWFNDAAPAGGIGQGLTLVHFSAQCKHILWATLWA
jgi:hypothetical protein